MRLIKLHRLESNRTADLDLNSLHPIYINPEYIEAMWTYRVGKLAPLSDAYAHVHYSDSGTFISMASRDSHLVRESMDEVYKLIFPDRAIPLPDPANTNTVFLHNL